MNATHAAEQSVIGAVLLDPGALARVRSLLPDPESFAHSHHRAIWQAVLALQTAGEAVDVIVVAERLGDRLGGAGGPAYLGQLMTNTPSAANVETYAEIVAREARRRHCAAELHSALDRLGHDDPDLIAGELQDALSRTQRTAGAMTMLDLIDLGFDALARSGSSLLATGVGPLDRMIGGLEGGRLYVTAARTGSGKSALGIAILHSIATRGFPVGMCSLEMPAREIINRIFAHRYGINLAALTRRHGSVVEDLDRAYQADPLSGLEMHFDDVSTDLAAILSRAHEWHYRHRIRALFVDYVGLVQVRGNAPRYEKIGECTAAFKKLAKRLSIPIIVAAQFNRESDKDDRRPRLSDLRDSGSVEQDADCVIAINPTSEPDTSGRRAIEIGILKNRSGTTGWLPDSITFEGRTQRFVLTISDT